jgi:hypothetical protein
MAVEDHGWGLDPLWDSYVRLTVVILKGLKAINPESPNILALPMGRAVEKVRVLGDIVSVKWKATSTMIEFHVDDGTGLLACIWWLNPGWGDKPYVKGGLCPSLVMQFSVLLPHPPKSTRCRAKHHAHCRGGRRKLSHYAHAARQQPGCNPPRRPDDTPDRHFENRTVFSPGESIKLGRLAHVGGKISHYKVLLLQYSSPS